MNKLLTKTRIPFRVLAVALVALPVVISAQHRPSQALIDACANKAPNDQCLLTGPNGQEQSGTCISGVERAPALQANSTNGERRPLACRMPRGEGGGPDGAQIARGAIIASSRVDTAGVLCTLGANSQNSTLRLPSNYQWSCKNGQRTLSGNGIPNHVIGVFPNAGNPSKVSVQKVAFSVPLKPAMHADAGTRVKESGMAINGIKFDPGTGGSCPDAIRSTSDCSMDRGPGEWRIEALGQKSFNFGVDPNNAHVQPEGSYHYHGLPTGLLTPKAAAGKTMQLIGWASDGFPMYANYGYVVANSAKSGLRKMRTSYAVKATPDAGRPAVAVIPMGGFVQDWEYRAGSGDLDECNGRVGVTPEFPKGIYHYYVTDSYPYVQRCVKGSVSESQRPPRPPGQAPMEPRP